LILYCLPAGTGGWTVSGSSTGILGNFNRKVLGFSSSTFAILRVLSSFCDNDIVCSSSSWLSNFVACRWNTISAASRVFLAFSISAFKSITSKMRSCNKCQIKTSIKTADMEILFGWITCKLCANYKVHL